MKIFFAQKGWSELYLPAQTDYKMAYDLVQSLYIRFPCASIYIDRGNGVEFVNKARFKALKPYKWRSILTSPLWQMASANFEYLT